MNGQQVRPTTGSMWACIETTLLLYNISYVCLLNSNWILPIVAIKTQLYWHLLAAKDVVKPGIGYVHNWSKSTSKVEGIWIGVREKPQAVISIISLWLSEHRSWWVVIVFYSHHSTAWLCTFQSILIFSFFSPWSWRMCCKEWLTPYFWYLFVSLSRVFEKKIAILSILHVKIFHFGDNELCDWFDVVIIFHK